MSQIAFGSGIAWGTPMTDASGNAIANPTPSQFGILQDCSLDFSFDIKMLYGQLQFPVDVARGKGKISGKAKFAQVSMALFNGLFIGQTVTNGIQAVVYDTTGSVIPATPYQLTPTVPNAGTFVFDLGVRDSNGVPMARVAAAPATGQYTVTNGVYLFAAADTGKLVFINFQYSATSTSAKKVQVINLPMGYSPTFRLDLAAPKNSQQLDFILPKCVASKWSVPSKQDDYWTMEVDFEAFADSAGNAYYVGTSE